jgi:hypothetical protein
MRTARFLPLALLCLVTPTAQALEWISIGVKAGVGRVATDLQYAGEELFEPDAEWTAVGGISAQWRLARNSRFDLMSEVWWLRPGFSEAGELHQATVLAVPMLLRSAVRREDPEAYVYFGPALEFVLDTDEHPIQDRYNDFALAGQAGIGVEKRLSKQLTGLVEFRFSAELTNLYDSADDDPIENLTHRWLTLVSGVRF